MLKTVVSACQVAAGTEGKRDRPLLIVEHLLLCGDGLAQAFAQLIKQLLIIGADQNQEFIAPPAGGMVIRA